MHLNTLAGRSYNDLMQYPIFPWILADYDSEELDFTDSSTFRDFGKPMGAQSPERLLQFKKRYVVIHIRLGVCLLLLISFCIPQIQRVGRPAWRNSSLSLRHALFVGNDSVLVFSENGTVYATFPPTAGSNARIIIILLDGLLFIFFFFRVGISI